MKSARCVGHALQIDVSSSSFFFGLFFHVRLPPL